MAECRERLGLGDGRDPLAERRPGRPPPVGDRQGRARRPQQERGDHAEELIPRRIQPGDQTAEFRQPPRRQARRPAMRLACNARNCAEVNASSSMAASKPARWNRSRDRPRSPVMAARTRGTNDGCEAYLQQQGEAGNRGRPPVQAPAGQC